MKKLKKATCILLMLCLCLSAAACGGRDVSGLGTLDMDGGSGGIGTLGEPKASSAPTEPTPTAVPQPTPVTETQETEQYKCREFTLTIPKGWSVDYDVVDVGEGQERLYLFVRDPADSHNMFFYIQAMEPFFVSVDAKNAWLPYVESYGEYAPVLTDPTAEELLRCWPSIYTFLQAEGGPLEPFFSNYMLREVLASESSDAGSSGSSYVLGKVDMPNAPQSLMFFQNTLQLMDAPGGLPSYAQYYISYDNFGIVLNADAPDGQLQELLKCLESLDLSGFASKSSITAGTDGASPALADVDLTKLK